MEVKLTAGATLHFHGCHPERREGSAFASFTRLPQLGPIRSGASRRSGREPRRGRPAGKASAPGRGTASRARRDGFERVPCRATTACPDDRRVAGAFASLFRRWRLSAATFRCKSNWASAPEEAFLFWGSERRLFTLTEEGAVRFSAASPHCHPDLSPIVIPSVVEGSWLDLNTRTAAGNISLLHRPASWVGKILPYRNIFCVYEIADCHCLKKA